MSNLSNVLQVRHQADVRQLLEKSLVVQSMIPHPKLVEVVYEQFSSRTGCAQWRVLDAKTFADFEKWLTE